MAGKLIIFSAPSGSGKSTIINFLLKQNLNLHFPSRLPAGPHVVRKKTEWNIISLHRMNSAPVY